jgi:hypothetical protein
MMLIYSAATKTWGFTLMSDDERYLILTISEGTDPRTRLFYQDLHAISQPAGSQTVELIDQLERMNTSEMTARYLLVDRPGCPSAGQSLWIPAIRAQELANVDPETDDRLSW